MLEMAFLMRSGAHVNRQMPPLPPASRARSWQFRTKNPVAATNIDALFPIASGPAENRTPASASRPRCPNGPSKARF